MCKKCRKAFRKDPSEMEDCDEYCPNCDNHYVLEAKTPELRLEVKTDATDDVRVDSAMLMDGRMKGVDEQDLKELMEDSTRLG